MFHLFNEIVSIKCYAQERWLQQQKDIMCNIQSNQMQHPVLI